MKFIPLNLREFLNERLAFASSMLEKFQEFKELTDSIGWFEKAREDLKYALSLLDQYEIGNLDLVATRSLKRVCIYYLYGCIAHVNESQTKVGVINIGERFENQEYRRLLKERLQYLYEIVEKM